MPKSLAWSAKFGLAIYFKLKYIQPRMEVYTRITRSRQFDKQLDKVPEFIRKKVMFWIFQVETIGISEVMKSPGYHDEPLKGQRKGQRSVRMNKAYRLIYIVLADRILIELLEVNKHEY